MSDEQVEGNLEHALGSTSTEQAVRIVYVPQAVFRVRAVARCTSTLPGHAEAILSTSFSADGGLLATGSGATSVMEREFAQAPEKVLGAASDAPSCVGRRQLHRNARAGPPLPRRGRGRARRARRA